MTCGIVIVCAIYKRDEFMVVNDTGPDVAFSAEFCVDLSMNTCPNGKVFIEIL